MGDVLGVVVRCGGEMLYFHLRKIGRINISICIDILRQIICVTLTTIDVVKENHNFCKPWLGNLGNFTFWAKWHIQIKK